MSTDDPVNSGECGGNAAPYVLGALTEDEHAAFAVHLETCAVCREEVAALQSAATALPAAAPQLSAPPELKRRIMAEVHEDARRARAESSGRPRVVIAPLRWRAGVVPLALGLAVIALIAVVIAGSSGGGARVIRAQVQAPGASASVRLSGGRAEISLAGMPEPSPGRVYQVWVKRAGAPAPTDALFTVTSKGSATVDVPGNIAGAKAVLVTSEPVGGSRVPTTAPVLVARLAS
jgi:anti-sigma-K factor RskA